VRGKKQKWKRRKGIVWRRDIKRGGMGGQRRKKRKEWLPSVAKRGGGRAEGSREVKCSGAYAVRLPRDYIPSIAIMRGVS